jgi:heterodisulfide reductase subunit A
MPESKQEPRETRPAHASNGKEPRIGVYTCYCGGNIGDVVDVEGVADALRDLPNVVVSRTDASTCSDAGQAMIEEDIKKHGLNRVVVGSCSPFLHEQTFRGTVLRAGLNPYLYHHVGIREQDSWVTHGDPSGATAKAIRLLSAGIAKARLLESLESIRLNASQHAMVIGGGVAGLRSALDLAQRGLMVTLIEKTPFLGGHMAQLETVFPTDESARDLLKQLTDEVLIHPNVTVFTNTEVVGLSGFVGDFNVSLRQTPRGVAVDGVGVEEAIEACPVEVPDEFNYGLTSRKAIYRSYTGCRPETPAIDWENCTRCGECLRVHPQGINLEAPPKTFELNVGAIVMATGFRPYEPRRGEFGYGDNPEVITLPQFIRLMAFSEGSSTLTWKGRPVRDVAMIHCVGSRQIEGVHEPQPDGQVNPYCSRVCCSATLSATNELKERFPEIDIYDVYQDIRTYGRGHEEIYRRAAELGIRFLRYLPEETPSVVRAEPGDTRPVLVRVKDTLTWGREIEIPVDLVVLAVGMMPDPVDDLIELLKITPGSDRFLLEVHPKLRPVETAVNGIVLAGTAQSPMNIQESCASAEAAAAKVSALLSPGRVELEPFVARVNADRCDGTGACVEICQYEGAIQLEPAPDGSDGRRAVVSPANCVGCGVCVGVCPNGALDIQGWTLTQYQAMVDAIAAELPELVEVEA